LTTVERSGREPVFGVAEGFPTGVDDPASTIPDDILQIPRPLFLDPQRLSDAKSIVCEGEGKTLPHSTSKYAARQIVSAQGIPRGRYVAQEEASALFKLMTLKW
jgi:hypothetical protein